MCSTAQRVWVGRTVITKGKSGKPLCVIYHRPARTLHSPRFRRPTTAPPPVPPRRDAELPAWHALFISRCIKSIFSSLRTCEPPTRARPRASTCSLHSTSVSFSRICGGVLCGSAGWLPRRRARLPDPRSPALSACSPPLHADTSHLAPAGKQHGGACALHGGPAADAPCCGGAPPPCAAGASPAAACGASGRRPAGRPGRQDGGGQCRGPGPQGGQACGC